MKKMLLIVIIILIYSGNVWGEKTEKIDPTLENISEVYAECAAYFTVVYHTLVSSGDTNTAAKFAKMQEDALLLSTLFAKKGRTPKMATKITGTRIEMYMKQMKEETNNRSENISILINKYMSPCKEAVKNPEKFSIELKDKLDK